MILFGLFNFLRKYSLNQFLYFLIFYFFLFLFQGHRFLGKTHQRNWYETASTGTGYLLLATFLSNTKFDFDHNGHEHRLLA